MRTFGVLQGFVLEQKHYYAYTKPVDAIIKHHNINYQYCADDTEASVALKPRDNRDDTLSSDEACAAEIGEWIN